MAHAVRRIHRWFGAFLILTVLGNFAAMILGPVPMWLTYLPLLPLSVLMLTGGVLLAAHWCCSHDDAV